MNYLPNDEFNDPEGIPTNRSLKEADF